jgi:hypothetical protein
MPNCDVITVPSPLRVTAHGGVKPGASPTLSLQRPTPAFPHLTPSGSGLPPLQLQVTQRPIQLLTLYTRGRRFVARPRRHSL